MSPRTINRQRSRPLQRHATRMRGGVHRPPPPNYLAIACRALEQALKIGRSLRPYLQAQIQFEQERVFRQQIEVALDRVYGRDDEQAGTRDTVGGLPSAARNHS